MNYIQTLCDITNKLRRSGENTQGMILDRIIETRYQQLDAAYDPDTFAIENEQSQQLANTNNQTIRSKQGMLLRLRDEIKQTEQAHHDPSRSNRINISIYDLPRLFYDNHKKQIGIDPDITELCQKIRTPDVSCYLTPQDPMQLISKQKAHALRILSEKQPYTKKFSDRTIQSMINLLEDLRILQETRKIFPNLDTARQTNQLRNTIQSHAYGNNHVLQTELRTLAPELYPELKIALTYPVISQTRNPYTGQPETKISGNLLPDDHTIRHVQFSGTYGSHTFTKEEASRLLIGETITIENTTITGKIKNITGRLAYQTYNNHTFLDFTQIT